MQDETPHEKQDGGPGPPRRRRLAVLLVLLVAAAAVYAHLWRTSPAMRHYSTRAARSVLGLPPTDGGGPKVIRRAGRRFISGGPRDLPPTDDALFDVTVVRIDPEDMRFGLGREKFPALIEPVFVTPEQAESRQQLGINTRVLVLRVGDDVRVYPIPVLRRHEVVNDVVGDRPVFAAYCPLAELGAIYDRRIAGDTFTFAVSGYTYRDPEIWDGQQAFVLWDRDTESLWWPPIGRAVAGPMVDAPLSTLEAAHWEQTTWEAARDGCADARVLSRKQDFDPPATWPRVDRRYRAANASDDAPRIAPPWPGDELTQRPR